MKLSTRKNLTYTTESNYVVRYEDTDVKFCEDIYFHIKLTLAPHVGEFIEHRKNLTTPTLALNDVLTKDLIPELFKEPRCYACEIIATKMDTARIYTDDDDYNKELLLASMNYSMCSKNGKPHVTITGSSCPNINLFIDRLYSEFGIHTLSPSEFAQKDRWIFIESKDITLMNLLKMFITILTDSCDRTPKYKYHADDIKDIFEDFDEVTRSVLENVIIYNIGLPTTTFYKETKYLVDDDYDYDDIENQIANSAKEDKS